jgi:1,4-alpha-glucan branching enzyme
MRVPYPEHTVQSECARLAREPDVAEVRVIKSRRAKGKASVVFSLDPRVGAKSAAVCGEWNHWSDNVDLMRRDSKGGFSLRVTLEAGRTYRFRYLLDGERWENDWAADAYVPNDFGGDDSVLDLTALVEEAPPVAKRTAPVKKVSAKTNTKAASPAKKESAGPAKKRSAAPVKKGAKKKSG